MYGSISSSHKQSFMIKIAGSSVHFGPAYGHCWTPNSSNPLPSIPQINGQTKAINRVVMHILWMHNLKHPRTWDDNLPYVQHNYNRFIHSYTGHNPFKVGLGFQPLGPIDIDPPFIHTYRLFSFSHEGRQSN